MLEGLNRTLSRHAEPKSALAVEAAPKATELTA